MKKRILACLLMLCMMVTMLPTTAFATEEVQNLEFSQAAGAEAEGTDTAATPSTTGKLAEVYWSDGDGSDQNDGTSAEQAVATFERAKELLAENGTTSMRLTPLLTASCLKMR